MRFSLRRLLISVTSAAVSIAAIEPVIRNIAGPPLPMALCYLLGSATACGIAIGVLFGRPALWIALAWLAFLIYGLWPTVSIR
jgi:hypothetical protein